tara:strand:+ start:247 stop:477 length:231 start_codon:yes stop_codon:yes gene_type:complete
MSKEKAIQETDKEYEDRTRIYKQAERVYFAVVEHLNLTGVMIEEDTTGERFGATRNTEKGRELYYLIEDNLRGEDK